MPFAELSRQEGGIDLEIINTLIGALAGAILGAWFTLKYVEEKKRKEKRKVLLKALLRQLESTWKGEGHEIGSEGIGLSQRGQTIWELLNSDLLDIKKDEDLIQSLHEVIGWVENYNQINNLANLAFVLNSDKKQFLFEGRDISSLKSRKDADILKTIIKEKLKIK